MRHPLRDRWDDVSAKLHASWQQGLPASKLAELVLELTWIKRRMRSKGLSVPGSTRRVATPATPKAWSAPELASSGPRRRALAAGVLRSYH